MRERHDPRRRRHRFDIVAYDRQDKPVLVVEVKRSGDVGSFQRLVEDTIHYVQASPRHAPFFLIADPEKIDLFKFNAPDEWQLAHTFDTNLVLRQYDDNFGRGPVYENYLASLLQAWLNDIASGWHRSDRAIGRDVFEKFDLVGPLNEGSLAVDARL